MQATVRDLIYILEIFFPSDMPMVQAISVLITIAALFPILRLHQNQLREPRQPRFTAWKKSTLELIQQMLRSKDSGVEGVGSDSGNDNLNDEYTDIAADVYRDIEIFPEFMGLTVDGVEAEGSPGFLPKLQHHILITHRLYCTECEQSGFRRSLRRRIKPVVARLFTASFTWETAYLFVAHCPTCRSDFYPDRITYCDADNRRMQRLEYSTRYIRISSHGIWCDRRIAIMQEAAVREFRAGWSSFANWINDIAERPHSNWTNRQSQRLFIEHFSRRLLIEHGHSENFVCTANAKPQTLASAVRDVVGKNSGVNLNSLHHGCLDCTHLKRYREDLIAEGAILPAEPNADQHVVGEDALPARPELQDLGENEEHEVREPPPGLPLRPPMQTRPAGDAPRGYVRMVVMDGKTVGHRICAIKDCTNPLVNYRNGRFCKDHLNRELICGIIPCGRPVHTPGAATCTLESHRSWYNSWASRFVRQSYNSVKRVIRQQRRLENELDTDISVPNAPRLQVDLPNLGDIPGNEVTHVFRAQSVYCLETVQLACGIPIGWGKCYRSESSPQVLGILNRIWEQHEDLRPAFIAYDDACDLLRHIATQNPQDLWIKSTKFVVDAWHYIGHRATDVLCRTWCNPTPSDGSQPDLVQVETDANGTSHLTRAFNSETAEQFNSWITGYEASLRQMSDVHFDFFVHVLFLLFKENVEKRIQKKQRGLPEGFFNL